MAQNPFHHTRSSAAGLVVLAGFTIFFLSLPLQVAAWELRSLLFARFEWTESSLPSLTRWFVDLFGYRPDSYLTLVTWWFFWPFVASFAHCHFRYSHPAEFSAAFRNAYIYCAAVFALFLALVLLVLSFPFVILLAELHDAPAVASLIAPASWVLPVVVAIVALLSWWRNRKRTLV